MWLNDVPRQDSQVLQRPRGGEPRQERVERDAGRVRQRIGDDRHRRRAGKHDRQVERAVVGRRRGRTGDAHRRAPLVRVGGENARHRPRCARRRARRRRLTTSATIPCGDVRHPIAELASSGRLTIDRAGERRRHPTPEPTAAPRRASDRRRAESSTVESTAKARLRERGASRRCSRCRANARYASGPTWSTANGATSRTSSAEHDDREHRDAGEAKLSGEASPDHDQRGAERRERQHEVSGHADLDRRRSRTCHPGPLPT